MRLFGVLLKGASMKKWSYIIAIIGVPVVATLTWYVQSQRTGALATTKSAEAAEEGAIVGVDELMKHTERYAGRVRVKGIVSGVVTETQMISLIDTREYEECGVTSCASLTLPIRWAGQMPKVQDAILVSGEVQESEGKLIFVAHSVLNQSPEKGASL